MSSVSMGPSMRLSGSATPDGWINSG